MARQDSAVKAGELQILRRRILVPALLGFILVPVFGLAAAWSFGLAGPDRLRGVLAAGLLPLVAALLTALAGVRLNRLLMPLLGWLRAHPDGQPAPAHLQRRLNRFGREYWGLLLCYVLLAPVMFFSSPSTALPEPVLPGLANFMLLQLSVAILTGLPAWLRVSEELGTLGAALGVQRMPMTLRDRLVLLAGLVPLLGYSLFAQYHWLHGGAVPAALGGVWAAMAVFTALVSWLTVQGLQRSLRPVEAALSGTGASTLRDLARLQPQSADEIGYLTHTLGKLFRRLTDQESHMRAVVENAAEGIIVLDEKGTIDTFNPAAEQLFGFLATEIQGRPVSWLLPDLVGPDNLPPVSHLEEETTGVHRNGKPIHVSVRVSVMNISERRMYTCLVADITKRKSAEQQLRHAEARYRDLVETAHDLVWCISREGQWTYLNSACQSIYGYLPSEMVGRHIREFRADSHAEKDQQAFEKLLAGEELVQYETVHMDRDGNPRNLSFNARAHYDEHGHITHFSGTARDITEQKAFERQLAYQAEHDALTGLFNRHYFQQELERTVARVARNSNTCALFYIDLDQFKYINDTLGHSAGDQLLTEISRMLAAHVREGDLLARFGGDEFTLLAYNIGQEDVPKVAENFRRLLEDYKFHYDGKAFNVTASVGAAMIDPAIGSANEVMAHADLACNMAKSRGRNRIHLYNPADKDKAGMAEDMGWAARVREMLEHDRFALVYQPIVSVQTGEVHDYEVLVRMVCDDGEIILPGGFMPAAERFGLIHSVDRWIVQRALRQLAGLRQQGAEVRFSINLSGRAFEDKGLLPLIQEQLRESGLDPAWVTFEITETAAIANLTAAENFIRSLKNIGCQFALDDFGSGFSSFAYLKHLPVDKLKIDGTFVQGMAQATVDQAMVQSMNQVAHALGKQTIAEYVESDATLELLKGYGVDYAQGNFIGRPREALINIARPNYGTA